MATAHVHAQPRVFRLCERSSCGVTSGQSSLLTFFPAVIFRVLKHTQGDIARSRGVYRLFGAVLAQNLDLCPPTPQPDSHCHCRIAIVIATDTPPPLPPSITTSSRTRASLSDDFIPSASIEHFSRQQTTVPPGRPLLQWVARRHWARPPRQRQPQPIRLASRLLDTHPSHRRGRPTALDAYPQKSHRRRPNEVTPREKASLDARRTGPRSSILLSCSDPNGARGWEVDIKRSSRSGIAIVSVADRKSPAQLQRWPLPQ
jgi:hypothetical protein